MGIPFLGMTDMTVSNKQKNKQIDILPGANERPRQPKIIEKRAQEACGKYDKQGVPDKGRCFNEVLLTGSNKQKMKQIDILPGYIERLSQDSLHPHLLVSD